jgi:5'-nucleotidase / UDP-sugar diphosphatase
MTLVRLKRILSAISVNFSALNVVVAGGRHAAAMCALSIGSALAFAVPANAKALRILLASDVYKMGEVDGRGGHARLAAAVNAERARAHRDGVAFLYVHAGDAISPCLMCGFDKGAHLIALMNMAPPDIFVPGNHEFDFGKSVFLQRMKEARFPIFAANLTARDGSLDTLLAPSKILDLDGIKVGIVGTTADDAAKKSNPQDLIISPTVATVERDVAALRAQGADFVIAVVHAARETDRKLIDARAADLVLSGDDHDLFWSYDGKSGFVEGGEDATHLNIVDADIRVAEANGKRIMSWAPSFRIVDTRDIIPDAEVTRVVASYEAVLSAELDVEVTKVVSDFDTRSASVRGRENVFGNVVADALRAGYDADIAMMNGGGLRGGKDYKAGMPFTRRDVLMEMPFGNKAVVVEIMGRDLRAVLEYGLSKYPEPSGRFPHISGAELVFDPSRPTGSRIVSCAIAREPLRDGKLYRLVINDFLFRGGDGYPLLAGLHATVRPEDGRLVANDVLGYLAKHGLPGTDQPRRVVAQQ